MLRKAGILIAAVMLMAFTAGVSLASDFLTYRDAGANYFPTADVVTSSATTPFPGRGNNMIDGLVTGIINGAATDVFVNPQGLGDALIYGYFNVRDNSLDVFSVTNTADYPVRARIRFLAGRNSIEMLDFDICLSEKDVWTSYIINDNGTGTLLSLDQDTPIDYGQDRGRDNGVFSIQFPDGQAFRYDGTNVEQDDTLEGYFIVIAENRMVISATAGPVNPGGGLGDSLCGQKAANTGNHSDMYLNDDALSTSPTIVGDVATGGVGNVLYGTNMLISATSAATYAYNATALGDFSNTRYLVAPTAANPNLSDASPDGINGVDFVLTKELVMQQWYDFAGAAQTEFIVNFPTRSFNDPGVFTDDRVLITVYDDMENSFTAGCTFSPCPVGAAINLDYEVNVVPFDNAAIFDSPLTPATPITAAGLTNQNNGWLVIDLYNATSGVPASPEHVHAVTVGGVTYRSFGLPAIGYVATDFGSAINWMLPLIYTNRISTP